MNGTTAAAMAAAVARRYVCGEPAVDLPGFFRTGLISLKTNTGGTQWCGLHSLDFIASAY
jgi:hypothetical protein